MHVVFSFRAILSAMTSRQNSMKREKLPYSTLNGEDCMAVPMVSRSAQDHGYDSSPSAPQPSAASSPTPQGRLLWMWSDGKQSPLSFCTYHPMNWTDIDYLKPVLLIAVCIVFVLRVAKLKYYVVSRNAQAMPVHYRCSPAIVYQMNSSRIKLYSLWWTQSINKPSTEQESPTTRQLWPAITCRSSSWTSSCSRLERRRNHPWKRRN